MTSEKLKPKAIAVYAAGSIGTGVFSTVPTVLLLYFCTDVLGISAAYAAAIVFLPKAWAIVWDPIVGHWSDRTHSRFGRRKPFMLVGALFMSALFFALFAPPTLTPAYLAIWMLITYFGLACFYSIFAVPYLAIPAEMTPCDAERARLIGWRISVAMLGVLIGAGFAPQIVEQAGGGRPGYAIMSAIVGVVCLAAMLLPLFGRNPQTATPVPHTQAEKHMDLLQALRQVWQVVPFRRLAAAYLLQLSAVGIISASTPYIVIHAMRRPEGDVGLGLGTMILVTILTAMRWSKLGVRMGVMKALRLACMLYAVSAVMLGIAISVGASWTTMLVLLGIAGLPFAGLQVLPFTAVANLIHSETSRGVQEATFTGAWTACEKLGLALGPALTGAALAIAGSSPSALAMLIGICPALLVGVSILVLQGPSAKNDHR